VRGANRKAKKKERKKEEMKLTPRQREVLTLAVSGLRDKEIALRLGCSTKAAKEQIIKAMSDNGCGNRMQLAVMFSKTNIS
jgi:DNA-binding NarL/FixJ family response regulator